MRLANDAGIQRQHLGQFLREHRPPQAQVSVPHPLAPLHPQVVEGIGQLDTVQLAGPAGDPVAQDRRRPRSSRRVVVAPAGQQQGKRRRLHPGHRLDQQRQSVGVRVGEDLLRHAVRNGRNARNQATANQVHILAIAHRADKRLPSGQTPAVPFSPHPPRPPVIPALSRHHDSPRIIAPPSSHPHHRTPIIAPPSTQQLNRPLTTTAPLPFDSVPVV